MSHVLSNGRGWQTYRGWQLRTYSEKKGRDEMPRSANSGGYFHPKEAGGSRLIASFVAPLWFVHSTLLQLPPRPSVRPSCCSFPCMRPNARALHACQPFPVRPQPASLLACVLPERRGDLPPPTRADHTTLWQASARTPRCPPPPCLSGRWPSSRQ